MISESLIEQSGQMMGLLGSDPVKRLKSRSAVSEAPTTVVDSSALEGRFRYSDLKETARRVSLWVLYVAGPVAIICKVVVGGCVGQLQREKVQRRGVPGCWVEV
jgi:hypothetical protein